MKSPHLSGASEEARSVLCELASRYHDQGWLFGTSGNLSARFDGDDSNRGIVVTASGRDKGALGLEDFVEVSLSDRGETTHDGPRPSAELSIHLAIYGQVPTARAVLHVHTVASSLLTPPDGAPGQIDFRGQEMIKGWGLWEADASAPLPFFRNHPDVPTIAGEIADWLAEPRAVPALVVERHGITAWGEDLMSAHRHLEITEFLCRVGLAQQSR